MSQLLETALQAAVAAGVLLRRKWPHTRQERAKGPRDTVTDADLAAQSAIAAIIAARYPGHAFLGEEGDAAPSLSGPGFTWVVDPLDGTTNYSRRLPGWSVSVAVVEDGRPLAGAVHDPLRNETFYAERGSGAFVRVGRAAPKPLRVSARANLEDAVVGVDWAHDPRVRRQVLAAVSRAAEACRTVRSLGSAALGLAYVAAGRLDGYFHLSLQPWDVAAGALLINEAGGSLSQPGGAPWALGRPGLIASNALLHAALLHTLGLGPSQDDP